MDIPLTIALWNANGLANHSNEIKLFLSINKIDVLLVTETHFTDRSYFNVNNYSIYCSNHPDNTAHGGCAVLIRNSIKHYMLPNVQFNCLQAASIVIESRNGPLTVSAVYCPPRFNLSFQDFDNFFQSLGNKFLAGGDYNAKHPYWGSRLTNPKGRKLHNVITVNGYDFLSTGTPTYWPSDRNKIPDLLDFFVTKGISQNNVTVNSSLDLSSDHSPVIVSYSTSVLQKDHAISHNLVDWEGFKHEVNCNISLKVPLKTQEDIEESINYFNCVILDSVYHSKKEIQRSVKNMYYPNDIKQKIAHKRRLRRIWQNSRNPQDKNRLNNASQNLKRCLSDYKNKCFSDFTSTLTATSATDEVSRGSSLESYQVSKTTQTTHPTSA